MSHFKKVLITIPADLLEIIDNMAKTESKSRSQMIREVMTEYAKEKTRNTLAESLAAGYQEMAEINLGIARECLGADEENIRHYEEKLTECE